MNPKSLVNERFPGPRYQVTYWLCGRRGPDHAPQYMSYVRVLDLNTNEEWTCEGTSYKNTIKDSQMNAAEALLDSFRPPSRN